MLTRMAPRLGPGEILGPQRVAGPLREHQEHPQHVRGREQLVLGDLGDAQLRAALLGEVLAPRHQVHAQRLGDGDHGSAEVAGAEQAERPAGQRDREPGLPAPGTDCPVLDASPLGHRKDQRPCHLRWRRQARPRLGDGRTHRRGLIRVGSAGEQDPTLDAGLVVDHVARPAVADQQLELGERLEHGTREAGPLLGDDHDLVVPQLLDEPRRRDRLTVDGDLRVGGQRAPVAVLQCDADVVVEDRNACHASTLSRERRTSRSGPSSIIHIG